MTNPICGAIAVERLRQERLRHAGRFRFTAYTRECPDELRLAMLTEELGEVARVLCERDTLTDDQDLLIARRELRTELVQVAAIAVAWVEHLDELELEEAG